MAASCLLRVLLVASLVFSHLLCFNAVPVTRTGNLMHGAEVYQFPVNAHMVSAEKSNEEEKEFTKGRMAVQLNDYPGSGANHRHTPRPEFGRGCFDC